MKDGFGKEMREKRDKDRNFFFLGIFFWLRREYMEEMREKRESVELEKKYIYMLTKKIPLFSRKKVSIPIYEYGKKIIKIKTVFN